MNSFVLEHQNLLFQQETASIHSARHTQDWLRFNFVSILDWTACSLDLNPIEKVWCVVVRDMNKDVKQYATVSEL